MSQRYNIAVVGATGNVGREMLQILDQRSFPVDEVYCLASSRSKGTKSEFNKKEVDISFPKTEKFDALPKPSNDGTSSYVSIMEGCNKYCSFCVVPHTRGNEISRPLIDVINEVKGLAKDGVKEIIFLGQNVNAYRDSRDKTKGLNNLFIKVIFFIRPRKTL